MKRKFLLFRLFSTNNSNYNSKFLKYISERDFLYQCTDLNELDKQLSSSSSSSTLNSSNNNNNNNNNSDNNKRNVIKAYLGFDATASSLHVGSLVQIMLLRNLQLCGHKPIVLIGGGTTKIGDPSGKDESRNILSNEVIINNSNKLMKVFEKFLKFGDNETDAIIVNNADWLDELKYIDFLREYGKHMSVNRMLTFESVKQRLNREQPLSFLEFNYMLLQAYDFVKLNQTHGVTLQLGGSDQWGNIVCGVELARKTSKTPLFGLTAPLISTSDGKKMGKSVSGAIWLDKELLSEYDYWQFWRNTSDADVIRFLKLFTDIPIEKIREYETFTGSQLNKLKIILANEATSMLHGPECLSSIHSTIQSLYPNIDISITSTSTTSTSTLSSTTLSTPSLQSIPNKVFSIQSKDLNVVTIIDLLFQTNITTSKSEGRRCIESGAIRIEGNKITDSFFTINQIIELTEKNQFVLSNGKKKHYLIDIQVSLNE